jgi:hypothetical protein
VVSWLSILQDPRALCEVPDGPLLVRIDSYGQDHAVEKAMLARGWPDAREAGAATLSPAAIEALREERGRILAPRQQHLGVERVLADLEPIFADRPRWTVLSPPSSVRELFDKRITSRRYAALGIPVPRALGDIATPDELRERVRAASLRQVYVKLSCGSSASCLGIYQDDAQGGSFVTTVELARPVAGSRDRLLYNSRKLRRYVGAAADEVLRFLLREGAQVEERVAKARLGGEHFDLRVLVIAGEPAFTVVRQSPREITNLHLGGRRGDPAELGRHAPPEVLEAALASARRVFDAHGCFHVGVDVMIEHGWCGHRVLEANAFGDFFPGLTRDGLSVYAWEIRAAEAMLSTGSLRAGTRSSTPSPKTA